MPNGVPSAWMRVAYDHPPLVVRGGKGGRFSDIDGNEYLDFNLADMSMFAGYGLEPVARAVGERAAAGSQFMLAGEDDAEVATELARRFGLPQWQFTLSATLANTEAIRVARAATGRAAVLMFDGKYHGHADELLATIEEGAVAPEGRGMPPDATRHVRIVQYNDLEAVERELASGDVACVLTEPAVTNCGVIQPAEGFHAGLRRLTADAGTLLVLDETHTLVSGPGGLTAHWGLEPDLVVMGKAIASGIPLGAYGMTAAVASVLDFNPVDSWGEVVATGGTLFGNALSMAAARVSLTEVLTEAAYAHAAQLGARLADGIESVTAARGLEWSAHRLFNRSGYTYAPDLPGNALEARATFDTELFNLQRLYMANRGVWEAIDTAGPACGPQTSADDVDRYLDVLDAFLADCG
ncbi:MAG: glutamate-semialdehyde -aminomutase [Solirubrobacteraceae bacterium]|nr:glutamate-semialdehyde -aminomutase [Solirubrobacteraceae bacterium]